jgi:alkanesulfonate monooxygenase SsuD/methylene tetrahydromethanopterin reductase-like flavin-dependent oxidoreductase (luciferase family)
MKFGVSHVADAGNWEMIRYAEELGFDRAWVPDSHMLWSDCYATMAVAALHTSKIAIGTGITNPGTRVAPVTANAIATINRLAPGRTFLGIGTGNTSMRLMGQSPVPAKEFAEYIRVVRALLDGEAVEYTLNGKTSEIQFMQQDRNYVNLRDRIPIYVAANGPKAMKIAGELSDGWIAGGVGPEQCVTGLQQVHETAKTAGRHPAKDFVSANYLNACVLLPGERLTDERVINQTGALVTANLHWCYEIWEQAGDDAIIPPHFAEFWDEFANQVASYPTKGRFRYLHNGHGTFLRDEERKYVTPQAIAATVLAGEPDTIIARIREFED